jgi:hypothetical protein
MNKKLLIIVAVLLVAALVGLGIWWVRREKFLMLSAVNFAGAENRNVIGYFRVPYNFSPLYGEMPTSDGKVSGCKK